MSDEGKLQVGEFKVEFKIKCPCSEKFDIRQTFCSEMSGKNSKCPAKDWSFAGQNV